MEINIMSFGFKYGIPTESDFVFDVRALQNPYYVPELKALTGLDNAVRDYVMSFDESKEFEKRLFSLVDCCVELCQNKGRVRLTLAVGCTGGRHRSVTFAENLYKHLKENYIVSINHRDILK